MSPEKGIIAATLGLAVVFVVLRAQGSQETTVGNISSDMLTPPADALTNFVGPLVAAVKPKAAVIPARAPTSIFSGLANKARPFAQAIVAKAATAATGARRPSGVWG